MGTSPRWPPDLKGRAALEMQLQMAIEARQNMRQQNDENLKEQSKAIKRIRAELAALDAAEKEKSDDKPGDRSLSPQSDA